ncbi:MAG TPA: glycosyltransferase family 39 protein [Accumulibacter sp.]|nr:glycosyltransferase family 39 protein [Accumulibacter sp.]
MPVTKTYRLLLLATVAVGALVFFWGLGSLPLLSYNEARRAIPASTMFVSGDWLLPRLNGDLYLAKPPLLYWLSAASAHLFGAANEWAVRLPSALAASVVAVLAYRYALRQFGPWPALFAVQILIANTSFAMDARRAQIEMLLTALCFSSLLAALHYTRGDGDRRWLWLSYLLLGAATLTKGPLALLFVTLPLLANALYQRQPRLWLALRDPIARVEVYLTRNGLASAEFFDGIRAEADDLGRMLRDGCRAMPDPAPLSMFDHVYAEITDELAQERDWFADYLASFEDAPHAGGTSGGGR